MRLETYAFGFSEREHYLLAGHFMQRNRLSVRKVHSLYFVRLNSLSPLRHLVMVTHQS